MTRETGLIAAAACAGLMAAGACAGAQPAARDDQAAQQARYESELKAEVSADKIGSYIKQLTARPNYPGAPYAESVADQTLALFKQWGWDARFETFEVMFPRAVEQTVE